MSCFICKKEALSKISNFIARLLNTGYNSFGFSASPQICKAFEDCKIGGFYNHNCIYEELYKLNHIAYNGRYKIEEQEIQIEDNPDVDIWAPRKVENCNEVAQPWHIEILKNIQCLEYQLSEDITNNEPKVNALRELINILALFIATKNSTYNNIEWY